jgi:hypothetical protein
MTIIDIIFDFAQICDDLLMGPTFERPTQIDTNDFAEDTGVDSFGIVLWKSYVHYSQIGFVFIAIPSFTKVVTQMVQFLSYSGAGDPLVFESDALEQERAFEAG